MPTSVRFDSETEEMLERVAREQGATKSSILREAVHQYASVREPRRRSTPFEKIGHLIGCFESGKPRPLARYREAVFRDHERKTPPFLARAVILTDAGPLIAALDRSDGSHEACARIIRSLKEPMATVWPAFTEAMYLLRQSWTAQRALWEFLEREALVLLPLGSADAARMCRLMQKYRDLPMDLADAALVRVAEREKLRTIFTLDRRDFELYRPAKIGKFRIVP